MGHIPSVKLCCILVMFVCGISALNGPDATRGLFKRGSAPTIKPENMFCKSTKVGREYVGTVAVTKTGKACQRWVSQTPHSHNQIQNHPEMNLASAENYCRNPDSESGGPWCYTTDSSVKWEYCNVYACECIHGNGADFIGIKPPKFIGGMQCQRWDSQSPHTHDQLKWHPELAAEENYCRNPDNAGMPWCYTMSPDARIGWCYFPKCNCKNYYRGTKAVTMSGKTCQRWDSQTPHSHTQVKDHPQEIEWDLAENYCRNPDNSENGPWCYTTDTNVRWEYCAIPPPWDIPACKYVSSGV